MKYDNIVAATFIKRPNRFVAHIELEGREELCHVKNTGRLGELLLPGAVVYVSHNDNPKRKTKYSLIAVEKDDIIYNIDSQAPNLLALEWVKSGKFMDGILFVKPEKTYKKSRKNQKCRFGHVGYYESVGSDLLSQSSFAGVGTFSFSGGEGGGQISLPIDYKM